MPRSAWRQVGAWLARSHRRTVLRPMPRVRAIAFSDNPCAPRIASHRQIPLLPRCLPGLRPERAGDSGAGGEADGAVDGGSAPAEVPDAGAKGPSDDGGRDELVESRASFSACSIASACSRHSSSTRASGLSASKKRRSMPERSTGPVRVIPPIESEPAGECHPHIVRTIPRATPAMGGEVNGYKAVSQFLHVGCQAKSPKYRCHSRGDRLRPLPLQSW